MSGRVVDEDGAKIEGDVNKEESHDILVSSYQDDRLDCKTQTCAEEVSDVKDHLENEQNSSLPEGETILEKTEEKGNAEVQHSSQKYQTSDTTSQRGLSKDPESGLGNDSWNLPKSGAIQSDLDVPRKQTESYTETYDVITKTEVQGLTEWESIHKETLSEIPPIDPGVLHDLESRAKDVAHNLDHLMGSLASSLKSLSVTGVQSVDAYRKSIGNVEETVDVSVKSMYTLIAKCEELNSNMGPLYSIAAQIKEIKATLDVFESMCK